MAEIRPAVKCPVVKCPIVRRPAMRQAGCSAALHPRRFGRVRMQIGLQCPCCLACVGVTGLFLGAQRFDTARGRWYHAPSVRRKQRHFKDVSSAMLMSLSAINKKSKKEMPD